MSDFEREIVHCLNLFFRSHHIQGFAYRFTSPFMDVLADSPDPSCHLSIECKSIIDKKLYFSQHFHSGKNKVHPVEAMADFLTESGRIGYLAVEFRQSPGRASEGFLIPWPVVVEHYHANRGITRDDARACVVLSRSKDGYLLESFNAK